MDNHVINHHGFIPCEKCEYIAGDKILMKQHKLKHTGSSLYICGVCEFDSILEEHSEIKHNKKSLWWHEGQKSDH